LIHSLIRVASEAVAVSPSIPDMCMNFDEFHEAINYYTVLQIGWMLALPFQLCVYAAV